MEVNNNIVLVIDIETTGFNGKVDKVVEIAAVRLDLTTGRKDVMFNHVVDEISNEHVFNSLRNAWVFKNTSLNIEEVKNAPTLRSVYPMLQDLFTKYNVTAFNRTFDINFLTAKGFQFPNFFDCPMLKSTKIVAKTFPNGNLKWPSAQEAYDFFIPDSGYVEVHRALDDAWHEAEIIYVMRKRGLI